jgi:hypothetical protein
MYKLNYYGRSIADNADKEQKFEYFDAQYYLIDIVQSEYRERGYATEVRVGQSILL